MIQQWCVHWHNRKRHGMSGVMAETEDEAREKCKEAIEGKYYWQGAVVIDSCKPAKPINEATA